MLELLNDFDVKERAELLVKGDLTRIRLLAKFFNLPRNENVTDVNRVIRRHYKEEEIKITQDYLCFETEVAKIFLAASHDLYCQ